MEIITDPKLLDQIVDHITELSAFDLAELATKLFDKKYTYIGEQGIEQIDTFEITTI